MPNFGTSTDSVSQAESMSVPGAEPKKGKLKRVFGFISGKGGNKRPLSSRQQEKQRKKDEKWVPDQLQRDSLAKMSKESRSIQELIRQQHNMMGKDFDENDFNIVCKHQAEGNEEEEDDQGSEDSEASVPELAFKLYNHADYFKITCDALDFDQDKL